jgi:hypothetical protein
MIRSFIPLDVVDLLLAGRLLSNRAGTKDSVSKRNGTFANLANVLGDWLNPQIRSRVWVCSESLAVRGLVSVKNRNGPRAWEINQLLVNELDINCCLRLLEHVGSAGGQQEVERLFLRLPVGSPLLKAAKETGFFAYTTEHLYQRKGTGSSEARIEAVSSSSPRRKKAGEDYRLFELYIRCVPAYIQRVEGTTFTDWQSHRARSIGQDWVFEKEGGLVGWLSINVNRNRGQFDMIAAARGEMETLVEYGLSCLGNCSPVYCLAPDYEVALLRLLEDRGFSRVTTYSALTKELAARVAEPYAMPAVPA